ncbi:hypothetical protein [Agathobaculum desmolans]|uniref:hypothetical protein n=1 Tax=Agathobaculum desmolans TaxID=39484 RepID=UPI0006923095
MTTMVDKEDLKIRLNFWRSAVEKLRAAYMALASGGVKSYTIDDRQLTRYDLLALKDEIADAEKRIDELSAQLAGQRPRRAFAVVPREW